MLATQQLFKICACLLRVYCLLTDTKDTKYDSMKRSKS